MRINSLCLILFLHAIFIQSSFAQPKEYVIGVENINLMPHFNSKGEVYYGYTRDLLDMFAAKYGYRFIYKPLPLKRLFKDLVQKKVDFKYPDNPMWQPTLKTAVDVVYSDAVVAYTEGVMVLPDRVGQGLNKLKDLTMVLGYTPWPYVEYIDNAKIREWQIPNFQGAIKMVLSKRVDGLYVNIAVGQYQLKHIFGREGALMFDRNLPHITDAYYLSSVMHPEVIAQFNEFLAEEAEAIEALKIKHDIPEL